MSFLKKYLFHLNQGAENTYKQEIYAYVKSLNLPSSTKILDIGCGEGDLAVEIAKIVNTKLVFGIDKRKKGLEKSKKKGIKVYDIDISKEKWEVFENSSFDLIISNQVIEHLFNIDNYLRNIYRIVKPGGKVVIATENLAAWHNIFSLLLGYQPFSMTNTCTVKSTIGNPFCVLPQGEPNIYMVHRAIMTYQAQKELFSLRGFHIDKMIGSVYYPFPNCISKHLSRMDIRHSVYIISCLSKAE